MMKKICPYAWYALHRDSLGRGRPCCRYDLKQEEFFDLSDSNSSSWRELRRKMLTDGIDGISGCIKCASEEKSDFMSLRHVAQMEYGHLPQSELSIENESIRYVDYTMDIACNLKCMTCSPESSTKWREDYKKMDWPYSVPDKTNYPPQSLEQILLKNPRIEKIKLLGGEPLMMSPPLPESRWSLIPKECILTFHTNVTHKPSEDWQRFFKHFRKIIVNLSIDAHGSLNDYIRYPSTWKTIEENSIWFLEAATLNHRFTVQLHATVSLYNIFSLDPLIDWWLRLTSDHKVAVDLQNQRGSFKAIPVIGPDFLSPWCLTAPQKQQLDACAYSRTTWGKNLVQLVRQKNKESLLPRFVSFTKSVDSMRGTDAARILADPVADLFKKVT